MVAQPPHNKQFSEDASLEEGKKSAFKSRFVNGLSAKLLWLTVIFVMIAEVLIFLPSIANFRNVWLQTRLDVAEAASIVFLDGENGELSDSAGKQLLSATMAENVAIRQTGSSQLMASSDNLGELSYHINLEAVRPIDAIITSLKMMFADPSEKYRVFSNMRSRNAEIELVQQTGPIQKALWIYARNVLFLSLIISVFTAALVYLALYRLIVKPMVRISKNMADFSTELENEELILEPTNRNDEIGVAEKQISLFQTELQKTLRQKQHMAELGMAVSKINHDMRNILASAQLFSDRLMVLPDPTVQRFVPKLIRTIDRAVDYTKSVLDYGKAIESAPKRRKMFVHNLVAEIAETLGLSEEANSNIHWVNAVDPALEADADPEQLFRILMNLSRNAVQALHDLEDITRQPTLKIVGERYHEGVTLRVIDNGHGIPEKVQSKIFTAFKGSTKSGGTGLGVTIAKELVSAHGGSIKIKETSAAGTVFEVRIPDGASARGDGDQLEI